MRASVAYRVTDQGLDLDVSPAGLRLVSRQLSVAHGRSTTIIQNIDFGIEPDAFVGILGPSGAGKSTLLNCLATYLPYSGSLVFDDNQELRDHEDICRRQLAYVPQHDALHEKLTVRQSLEFVARLRGIDADSIVPRVLADLGLSDHSQKPISKLSGGQRKRVSVGMALLSRPRLLLLDEPTAGLDPASESSIMEHLRRLSRQGTTVVCTTHLMENIQLFDQLMVLCVTAGVGELTFAGTPQRFVAETGTKSFADIYEQLAAGHLRAGATLPTSDMESDVGNVEDGSASRRDSSKSRRRRFANIARDQEAASAWTQFRTIAHRALLVTCKDRFLVIAIVLQPVALALLTCFSQSVQTDVLCIAFFATVIAIWLGMNNSARDLVHERRIYIRERMGGLRAEAYLGGKLAAHLLVGLFQILFMLAALWFVGSTLGVLHQAVTADMSAFAAFRWFAICLIAYLGGLLIGLTVSAVVTTEETAVAVLPLLIMPQLLLSRVAAGLVSQSYSDHEPYRPLGLAFHGFGELEPGKRLLDLASFLCLSRPASLAAEAKSVRDAGQWLWLGDALHLVLLNLTLAFLAIWAFSRNEQRWLRLLGVRQ